MIKVKHLLTIEEMSKEDILAIFQAADKPFEKFPDKTVANIFFEPSTRTRVSFELATKRLGSSFVNLDINTSAATKGEEVLDTIKTIDAMGIDAFIIRHGENGIQKFIADNLDSNAAIINAGDGTHAHPTQALLDTYTIQKHKKDFLTLKVVIIGDIKHSRVARSEIAALKKLETKNITLIGPKEFIPDDIADVNVSHDLKEGIKDADVLIALRVQKERISSTDLPDLNNFHKAYGLTPENVALAKPDAIIMHPGPMNRGIEIASDVADGKQSVILEQVGNGVKIRMAVLQSILG